MNELNLYVTVSAVVLGIGSALLNLTGRQKYKDNASFFESANHELREQNSSLRDEKATLTNELIKAQTESAEKDKTIKQLKPLSELSKIASNNHREILQTMATNFSDIMKALTEKIHGK